MSKDRADTLRLKIAAMEAELAALGEAKEEPLVGMSIQVPGSVKVKFIEMAESSGTNMNALARRLIVEHVTKKMKLGT